MCVQLVCNMIIVKSTFTFFFYFSDFDTSGSYLISPDHIPVITHKLTVEEDKDDNLKKELTKEKKDLDDEDIERDKEEDESQVKYIIIQIWGNNIIMSPKIE